VSLPEDGHVGHGPTLLQQNLILIEVSIPAMTPFPCKVIF